MKAPDRLIDERRAWSEPAEAGGGPDALTPKRADVPREDCWALERLYPDEAAWLKDLAGLDALAEALEAWRGRLDTPENVAGMLADETRLDRALERLYTYAHLRADEDTSDTARQALLERIGARATQLAARLAWIQPELLAQDEATLLAWAESPALKKDAYAMRRLARRKPHILSEPEETLLSGAGEIFAAPHKTFNLLTNADMRFPPVTDADRRSRELTEGRFLGFMTDPDRRVRRDAFHNLLGGYRDVRNTLAGTLSAQVKVHNFFARVRHYPSALEASLDDDTIPVALYDRLIETAHDEMRRMADYLDLRRRALRLEDLNLYDLHVPIVKQDKRSIGFDQARDWILEACRPLGEAYQTLLREAFEARWIDRYENRGKRSGAYSGGCYDSLPYILLNYHGLLDDVFTLAHELGHSLHSRLANDAQPHRYARYPIFIAEIASTLNEELLLRYLLGQTDDPAFRAYLLNHRCDAFRGTVFRQTLFAEYERGLHEADAEGVPLTADELADRYLACVRAYHPGMKPDEVGAWEWARIPHFYYNFYVYKYATSYCASQLFVERVLEGEVGREAYLDLLRAGGADDPLVLVRRAGVDLTEAATLRGAFEGFGRSVRELDDALAEGGGDAHAR